MAENNPQRVKKPRSTASRGRLLFLMGFLFLWMCAVAARLVSLQVFRYGEFTQRAARQQQRTVEVAPRRGVIYDRNGHELAMTVLVDSVFAVPSEIPDQANAAGLVAHVLGSDPREVLDKLQSSRNFVWLARKVDNDTSTRLHQLNLRGIYFQKEFKRFYPKNELAAQVLGYVGTDDEGLGGIERSFDDRLRGKPGKMLVSVDARQQSLGRIEKQPDPGGNIVLTLDEQIQYIAERELDRAVNESHAAGGTIVVQNPATGELLALASRPTFNPNDLRNSSPAALTNRSISDIYEPGSTFKIVTLSAAIEEKLARPDEIVDCQMGSIKIFGHTIHDHKAYGDLTVAQILQNSSDVGAIKLGLRLGEQRLDHYIRAYGFGSQTGIELPGETRGLAKPVSRWSKVSIGAISMGQEIGVTPVQVVSMVSAIANDGVYTPPRIVAGVVAPQSTPQTISFHPAEQHRVISTMTAAEMKKMLEDVVLYGTGKKAILDGYSSAGKTGTAQKVDPRTGRYSKVNYIASFAGFAPVNKPAITVLVVLDSPKNGHEGGLASAPVWARVVQQVLAYMNVPHDTDINNPQRLMLRASAKPSDFEEGTDERLSDDLIGENPTDSGVAQAALPASTVVRAGGEANLMEASLKKASPAKAKSEPVLNAPPPPAVAAKGTVILDAGNGPLAPSLIGKTVRGAIEAAERAGVEIDVVGSGTAVEQEPAAGQPVPPGTHLVVRFGR